MAGYVENLKMAKSVYSMKIHEELQVGSTFTHILRVPGGWIYTTHHPYQEGQRDEYRPTAVFVPITKEGAGQ